MPAPDPLDPFHALLEARHLSELTFAEVRRALQALSSVYVERRERMAEGAGSTGPASAPRSPSTTGRCTSCSCARSCARSARPPAPRAAPGPRLRHRHRGRGLGAGVRAPDAGRGVDRSGWAVAEARWTSRASASTGRTTRADATTAPPAQAPGRRPRRVHRERARGQAHARGCCRACSSRPGGLDRPRRRADLRRVTPRWPEWAGAVEDRRRPGARTSGASAPPMPTALALLGKAAGLDAGELSRPVASSCRRGRAGPAGVAGFVCSPLAGARDYDHAAGAVFHPDERGALVPSPAPSPAARSSSRAPPPPP